jgi:hypothetical protein
MARSNLSEEERYWAKVDKGRPDECWEWTAYRNRSGYGCFGLDGTSVLAHRYAWKLATRNDPGHLCVLHHCDSPACQNPRHHFLGTRVDNAADRDRKGRQARGERMGSSVLTEDLVGAIHHRYEEGVSVSKGAIEGMRTKMRPGTPGLNPDRVRAIRRRFAAGEGRRRIASDYGIRPKTVNEVVAGRNWAGVI